MYDRDCLPPMEPSYWDRVHRKMGKGRAARTMKAAARRKLREAILRAEGFEEVTPERRKKNLALNVALRDWPYNE